MPLTFFPVSRCSVLSTIVQARAAHLDEGKVNLGAKQRCSIKATPYPLKLGLSISTPFDQAEALAIKDSKSTPAFWHPPPSSLVKHLNFYGTVNSRALV